MKLAMIAVLVSLLSGRAVADPLVGRKEPLRVAETANACLVNCASQNDACKRTCPTTYNGPCVSACDNQVNFCRQTCQGK
jgi:hypothetical protein